MIASYGNICASGGVFVSSGCSTILASPGTITGSIGVATIRPHITPEALDLVGVTTDEVVLTEGAKDSHFTNSLSEKGWKRHRSIVDDMYVRFKSIVSEGRRMSTEQVEDIAQGQIWSGSKAVEIGLVDHIGTFDNNARRISRGSQGCSDCGQCARQGARVDLLCPRNQSISSSPNLVRKNCQGSPGRLLCDARSSEYICHCPR